MKKFFTLTLALLASFSLWATDLEIPLTNLKNFPLDYGLVTITNTGNTTISSNQLQVSKATATFQVSTKVSGVYLKSISFTDANSSKNGGFTCTDGEYMTGPTENVYTYTAPTTTTTAANFQLIGKGGTAKMGTIIVTVSTSDQVERLSAFGSISDSKIPFTSSVTTSNVELSVPASNPVATSSNRINIGSGGKHLIVSGKNHKLIKYIAIPKYQQSTYDITWASTPAGSATNDVWTPTSSEVKSVDLTLTVSSTVYSQEIYVGYTDATTYTVTYNNGGGKGTMTDSNSPYEEGDEVTLLENTFTAPDASSAWSGWTVTYTDGESVVHNVTVTDGKFTMPAYNVTVTAQWATAYDVKFFPGYGENVQIGETQHIGSGSYAEAPADPEREGYQFTGWSISTSADDIKTVASYAITEATNFTAIWVESFAITKETPSNGSITVSAESAIAGATITLTATPATDYLFEAWDVYKTGDATTKVTVSNNQFTMPAYAVTVNATFVADTRTKILYLVDKLSGGNWGGTSSDKLYAALKDDYNITIAAPNAQTLTNYALIVLHESIGGTNTNAAVSGCKTTSVPVLNTKSYFYNNANTTDQRWNWGTPNAGKSVKGCTINTNYTNIASHPLFADVTISEDFVEITDEAADKCMQPIGAFTTGIEGYTLATAPNASSGNGCAIHEIPAGNSVRGAESGKYLMISVSNAKLNALNANGQKLFQNAVTYLLSNTAWVPSTTPTALDNTDASVKAVKSLKNGVLIIEKNGKKYNIIGSEIR